MALTSSRWAAASNLVDGSNEGGGGRAWNGGGARDRAASSSSCSSNSMAIVQTPATSRASKLTTFSVIALAIASRARSPCWVNRGRGRVSVQGMSAWQAKSSSWISLIHNATSSCLTSAMDMGIPHMALRPFLNTIAMATSTGLQFGSPHWTSRALIKTVSGTARMACLTVSGRRSLAHATTRAEAFWRWPILLGSNMPVSARGAGGRRTIGLSAAP